MEMSIHFQTTSSEGKSARSISFEIYKWTLASPRLNIATRDWGQVSKTSSVFKKQVPVFCWFCNWEHPNLYNCWPNNINAAPASLLNSTYLHLHINLGSNLRQIQKGKMAPRT